MKAGMLISASLIILSTIWLFTVPIPASIKISDPEFRQMTLGFSESGGSFPWDNVLSNELSDYLDIVHVFSLKRQRTHIALRAPPALLTQFRAHYSGKRGADNPRRRSGSFNPSL
jgi:hypothetical protein